MRFGQPRPVAAVAGAFVALAFGCSRAPLGEPAPAPADAGRDVEVVPRLDWAIPVGTQTSPTVAGSTTAAAVVPTSDGGAIVAGHFVGTISFAVDKTLVAGPNGSGFVARYRSDQQLVWVRPLTAPLINVADAAGLGNDEIAVVGWFEGALDAGSGASSALISNGGLDLFVARFASDGSLRWSVRAGGPGDDIVRGVSARDAGGGAITLAITGAVGDAAAFGSLAPSAAGDGPIYAATLDGDGRFGWVTFAGGGVPGQGYAVGLAGDGSVSVAGYVNGPAPFGVARTGDPITIDPARGRAFVARWLASGTLSWARSLAGPAGEGDALAIAADGSIVACGLFEGDASFGADGGPPTLIADTPGVAGAFLAALDPADGSTAWARRLAGSGVRPWRLRAAPTGLLVAASFGGGIVIDPEGTNPGRLFSKGSDDPVFVRLGNDGTLIWAASGGGPGDDEGVDFSESASGRSFAVGDYVGPASFGTGDQTFVLQSGTDGAAFLLNFSAQP